MKKTISIFLSVLMLASSSGIAYAQHFCGGMEMMSKIMLGEKHLSCGMDMDDSEVPCENKTLAQEQHDCCQNQILKIQTDENFAKASFDLQLDKTFVAAFFAVFILSEVELSASKTTAFADYSPPFLRQDLNILYETFLI